MPTQKKESQVEEIKDRLAKCTIAIATGYSGMSASNMTGLRAHLKDQGIEYKVVKNSLTIRAASQLGKEKYIFIFLKLIYYIEIMCFSAIFSQS